jgi:hypothetical protein
MPQGVSSFEVSYVFEGTTLIQPVWLIGQTVGFQADVKVITVILPSGGGKYEILVGKNSNGQFCIFPAMFYFSTTDNVQFYLTYNGKDNGYGGNCGNCLIRSNGIFCI